MELVGDDHANELLAEGWKLLAVVPGGEPSAKMVVTYVLGETKLFGMGAAIANARVLEPKD